jgi:DNA-binding CsgD family transcriptional regulator
LSLRSAARPGPEALVGRAGEVAAVRAGVSRARTGAGGMIVLRGGLGSGKSTLLDALPQLLDTPVRTVRCATVGEKGPLAALFPDLPGGGASVPPSYRLRAHVRQLTSTGPLVIAVDDADRCDAASAEILDLLARRGRGLLVVAAVADLSPVDLSSADMSAREGAAWARWGASSAHCRRLSLPPFTTSEVGELIKRWWSSRPDARFVSACARASGGNPLVLRETLDRLRRAGRRPEAFLAGAVAETAAAVRAELLAESLPTRPAHVRAVGETVAVLGHTDRELVAMHSGISETLTGAVLDELDAGGLLDGADLARLRDIVFGASDPGTLAGRHARAARILGDAGRPATEIAPHLLAMPEASEPWMRQTLRVAARATTDRDTAIRYLTQAGAADPGEVDTLTDYAHRIADRDPYAARRLLFSGLDRVHDARDRAVLAVELAWLAPATTRWPSVVPVLDAALAALDTQPEGTPTGADRELRARGEAARLAAEWARPHATGPQRMPAGETRAERDLLALRAFSGMLTAEPAATAAARARAALTERGPLGWPHAAASFALAMADGVDDAADGFERVIASTEPGGWTQTLARTLRALVLADTGGPTAALADARAAVAAPDTVDTVHTARVALGVALHRSGDLRSAVGALPSSADTDIAVLGRPLALLVRAAADEADGNPDSALRQVVRCGEVLTELGVHNPLLAPWWLDAARLHAARGDRSAAATAAEAGASAAHRWGSAAALGMARLAEGMARDEVDALAEAVDLLSATSAEWHCTRAELAFGEALLRRGDRVGARPRFRAGADRAVRCGYRGLATVLRARLIAAGGRMRRVAGATGMLTSSERRIAELAAAGDTNREIADRLLISVRTVETHLTSVYRKLGVPGRSALRVDPDHRRFIAGQGHDMR